MSKISKIIDIKIVGTQELQDLEKAIIKAETKLKAMNTASKKNAGMQKIHAKNIVNTKLKLKQLRQERNAESKAILLSSQNSIKLDGSYNSLIARNKELLIKMKATTGGINSNSASMQRMKAEYTANNTKVKEFDKSLGNNQRNVGNYGSALSGVKEKLSAVGIGLGAAVLAFQAVSRVVSTLSADFGEFEKGFTNVLSLMSSDDINKFGDSLQAGAIDVMKEFGLEIGDMNKALFDAVSAGVPAADAVDFLRVASELAIGGVTDLTTATDGITSVINAFGLETNEATEVASAFFSAQKFGKTTVEELSNSIGSIAPIAKQAGVGYKDLLSAMAVLTKQGLKTDLATTALRASITALANPSETAKKEFEKLGIQYGLSALQGNGFMETLKQISVAAETDSDAITKLIPNVRALTGIGALGEEQLKDYDEILKQVTEDYGENSSLAAAVALQQETLTQQQARLNSEWSAQKVLVGEELKPIFSFFISLLSGLVKSLTTITKVLKTGAVAATAYGAAILIANIRSGTFKASTISLTGAFKKLNTVIRANPYAALAGLVAGVVYAYSNWNKQLTDLEKNQKNIDDINNSAEASTSTQISSINALMDLARDESKATELREKAINRLNKEVGELNGKLTLQTVNTEATTNAIAANTSKILVNARVKASQSKLEAIMQAQLEKEGETLTENIGTWDIITSYVKNYGNYTLAAGDALAKGFKNKAKDIEGLKGQSLAIAEYITSLTEESVSFDKNVTLKSILNTKYGLTVSGLSKRLADLKQVEEAAANGSATQENARKEILKTTRQLTNAINKQGASTLSLSQVQKLEEGTLNQINSKKTEYNKILKNEIVNSDRYKAIQKEIIRLTNLAAEGDVAATVDKAAKIKKIEDEISELTKLDGIYKQSSALSEERTKNEIKLRTAELELIVAKGVAEGKLSSEQINAIEILKGKIIDLKGNVEGDDGDGGFMAKIFGEGPEGDERLQNTLNGLSAINGLIGARADLQNKQTDEKIKGIDAIEAKELKALKDSARYQSMTDEQKAAAELKITQKADDQREVIEREAFERNKKASKQQAIISGAMAIMKIASNTPFPLSLPFMIAQALMTKMQLDTIAQSTFGLGGMIEKYAKGGELSGGGVFSGKSHKDGGIKFQTGGRLMEAEGGEAIINRASTSMFRNELSAINQAGGGVKFADGGVTRKLDGMVKQQQRSSLNDDDVERISMAINTQEVVVTESQISNVQKTIRVQESRMSF